MIRCACLVVQNQPFEILLVRVRDNQKWYLPGGKIEPNEKPEQTLIRELKEELGVSLSSNEISYLTTVIGAAYGVDDCVELVCFSVSKIGVIKPLAEISEVRFVNWQTECQLIAPAVLQLCDTFLDNVGVAVKGVCYE